MTLIFEKIMVYLLRNLFDSISAHSPLNKFYMIIEFQYWYILNIKNTIFNF